MLGYYHYVSIGATLFIISLAGLYSTRMVKSSGDFIVGGRKLGTMMVFAGIVGAFAGGTVTIGTAQMAYLYGISGIWFTLGAGIACLILAVFIAGPLRAKRVDTIAQFLSGFYGTGAKTCIALFIGLGMFIQMTVQMLASAPLLVSMFPVTPAGAIVLFAFISLVLVIGGGFISATVVGILKLVLLTVTLFFSGATGWTLLEGAGGIERLSSVYACLDLFPRGFFTELAGGLSVIVGFISTQSFLQPVFAGKDIRSSRLGSMLAALALPVFGAAGVIVGLYMRSSYPGIDPAAALPLFMLHHLPQWIGGLGVATLLVSLLMTAGALALGIATLFSRDILPLFRPGSGDREQLRVARSVVLISVSLSCIFGYNILGDLILDWSYLSNALRGVTVFIPLLVVVFMDRRVYRAIAIWAFIIPPASSVLWVLLFPGFVHPLYVGLGISFCIIIIGLLYPGSHRDSNTAKM
ncbi:MAG: sodium:solute symporter family protein [Bacillota bacterium]